MLGRYSVVVDSDNPNWDRIQSEIEETLRNIKVHKDCTDCTTCKSAIGCGAGQYCCNSQGEHYLKHSTEDKVCSLYSMADWVAIKE